MTVDFINALFELVLRDSAEGNEMGRLASARQKFVCKFMGMRFDETDQPMT
jgi:hypothetical protein